MKVMKVTNVIKGYRPHALPTPKRSQMYLLLTFVTFMTFVTFVTSVTFMTSVN